MPEISVIICTYNRDKYIYNVLDSLARNDFPKIHYEIVLIDNNSTDSTQETVERFSKAWPDVCLRCFIETRQGLSYARNRGIEEAKGDVLVFLDDDAFVGEKYLHNLSQTLASNPSISSFGGKITPLFENGKTPKWLCRWTLSWVSSLDMGESIAEFAKGYPIGANMGFRKEVFSVCGGFNTSLGRVGKNLMGGEEKEMFLRIRRNKYGIFYIPGIEVHHIIPVSRTTNEYISRLGKGIGISEKTRCKDESRVSYLKRIFLEIIKWGGTIILWLKFFICLNPQCGNKLVLFRWNVTKGLL